MKARALLAPFPAFLAASVFAGEIRVSATSGQDLDAWSARVEALLGRGELVARLEREDTLLPGRTHERLAQHHRGVPVFGGELARQSDGRRTLTLFGSFHEGIELDTVPRLTAAEARRRIEARGARPFGLAAGPELMVLPLDGGGYRLVYRVRAASDFDGFDIRQYFLDAASGDLVLEYSDLQSQSVGSATGVLNDAKKISTLQSGGAYLADDRLRPPVIATYDFRGNVNRLIEFLLTDFALANLRGADLAVDSDNVWTDGANVDAHVYAGYTYDYYFKRFARRGLDNANIPIRSVTHPIRRDDWTRYSQGTVEDFFINAYYLGDGLMFYGDGLPPGVVLFGRQWNFLAGGLDIVAHELTHGVTDYSSRLVYRNESGALNEAFSDIMAASVEFFFQPPGSGPQRADYLSGEDVVTPNGIRSMQNPLAYGDPDHYAIRYLGSLDNGGVHINSGIANHAFYLAVEGGTHRLGVAVQGVGAANREQIERVFYRAFTSFLTPASDFAAARAATIQAARELFGTGSAAERAVTQAWTAVGVN